MRSKRWGMSASGILCGRLPSKPSNNASNVPCPIPVKASEPYTSMTMRATCVSKFSACSKSAKAAAAFIGPTVCELDGPMPILKISKILIIRFSYHCVCGLAVFQTALKPKEESFAPLANASTKCPTVIKGSPASGDVYFSVSGFLRKGS